jgi:two-component system CheB/CheR fusion protein
MTSLMPDPAALPAARLLRVVSELTAARDLAGVTAVVRSAARELTGADGVTFVVREQNQCYYADEDAVAPLFKGRRLPIHGCIAGWTMIHARPAVVPNIFADSRIPVDLYRPTFVRSLAMVPVRSPEPVAAIGAYWASEHQATAYELEILTALADSTSLALVNVQLFDELRGSVAREQAARARSEAATAAKDEFLALVAHELRQPLHASLAALRLMEARTAREEGLRARGVVERQIRHMNLLVEDLLDAARIVRGHVALRRSTVSLIATIRHAIETVRPLAIERAQTVTELLPDMEILVDADPGRLQQVLMNLLTNASKYTDRGGTLAVEAGIAGTDAVITVTDTGCGIEPELLPQVFDLFTRGRGDASGFGVGLAVTRKLVELHDGSIEARSGGSGQGSAFVVRLPLSSAG